MSISLFPCDAVVTCGPCPACDELQDFQSPSDLIPPSRLIVYRHTGGGELVSGSITYTPPGGGANITISMTVVPDGSKLCIYRDGNYTGPLIYSLAVPMGATLVSITYTLFYPPSTYDTFTKDIVSTCTDGTTQVLVSQSELPICGTGVTVVAAGAACPTPCTDSASPGCAAEVGLGSVTATAYAPILANDPNPPYAPLTACRGNAIPGFCPNTLSGTLSGGVGSAPQTPSKVPCDWSALALSGSKTIAVTSGFLTCGGTATASIVVSFTKAAGSNSITWSSTITGSFSKTQFDQTVGGNPPTTATVDLPIGCVSGWVIRITIVKSVYQSAPAGQFCGFSTVYAVSSSVQYSVAVAICKL
jgi:hypothetical protein